MGLEDKLRKGQETFKRIKRVLYPIYELLYRAEVEGNRSIEGPAVLFFLHPHAIDYAPIAYAVESPISFVYRESAPVRGFKVDFTTSLGKMAGGIPLRANGNGHEIYKAFCNVLDQNGIVGIALQDDSGVSDTLEVRMGGVEMCLLYQMRRKKQIDLVPVGMDYSSIANKVMTFPGTNIPIPLLTKVTTRIGEPMITELPDHGRKSFKDYAEMYAFAIANEAARLSNLRYDSITIK
jgi:hypothetical protein